MTPADRQRVAQFAAWREQWLACEARVRRHANVRAERWVERHVPERFGECAPWQLPERLQVRWRRREDLYAERLVRADAHRIRAHACADQIARMRAAARTHQPRQASQAVLW